jgi:rare lipoprotein A
VGLASWYGGAHQGQPTASGEPFDKQAMTAAHRSLAFGTIVRVTNLASGWTIKVRINDRGPHVAGRIIDLSARAARELGIEGEGVIRVRIEELASDQTRR